MDTAELFLTAIEEKKVVEAIYLAELNTSGEIRVHIENTSDKPLMERASEVFYKLKMDRTKQRNGVLFYLATTDKKFVILGDQGIHEKVGGNFWEEETKLVIDLIKEKKHCEALVQGIQRVGEKLKVFFPYQLDDKNELTDEISKG